MPTKKKPVKRKAAKPKPKPPVPEVVVLTDKMEKFISMYITNFHISNSCNHAGVSRRTYKNWKDSNPLFNEMIEDIDEGQLDNWEALLYKAGIDGDLRATMFALERKGAHRGWSKEPTVQVLGLNVSAKVHGSTDAELEAQLKQMRGNSGDG